MNKHINFEDNIFILNVRIRMLRDMLILDTDPELFLEKTMDDTEFINTGLELLLGQLLENERLIERDDQLYNLRETEKRFLELLSNLESGRGSISGVQFPVICPRIAGIRENSILRRKTIEECAGRSHASSGESMVVSSDELHELLKAL